MQLNSAEANLILTPLAEEEAYNVEEITLLFRPSQLCTAGTKTSSGICGPENNNTTVYYIHPLKNTCEYYNILQSCPQKPYIEYQCTTVMSAKHYSEYCSKDHKNTTVNTAVKTTKTLQ